jgi:hypothetical protein
MGAASNIGEAKMNYIDPRLFAETIKTVQGLSDSLRRLQGRINALELICLQTIEDAARFRHDPKAYMLRYVERARARALPLADVDDQSKTDRTATERNQALEDFLTDVLERAASLKLD